MKRVAIGCIVALGLVLGGAVSAQAGEYNGKGGYVPGGDNGKSLCSYSGRDLPDDIEVDDSDDPYTGGHVQSYGVYVSQGLKELFHCKTLVLQNVFLYGSQTVSDRRQATTLDVARVVSRTTVIIVPTFRYTIRNYHREVRCRSIFGKHTIDVVAHPHL